jgi:lipopolysaccharide transport system ATP-binding protein
VSNIAIRAEHLAKQYRIGGAPGAEYGTLRDQLSNLFGRNNSPKNEPRVHWALQDISFEIKRGEVVGIIGRNGAGKSTLLKLLSRITEPSRGKASIYGRVASLLEVGTGFHPELTGRENTYLNGAILGMSRHEIERKFDEIVAFAEIEKFIDTPVKFYSSGMYLRLAFAVAAHLEPEILIVDEVLAVGDSGFQKKCINKMEDVGQQGRTVLFVSHSMPTITRLCERAILLDGGVVAADGPAPKIANLYLNSGLGVASLREWADPAKAPGGEVARLRAVRAIGEDGEPAEAIDIRQSVRLEMEFEVLRGGAVLLPHFQVQNEEGIYIFSLHDLDPQWRGTARPAGRYRSSVTIPGNMLAEGTVYVTSSMITLSPDIVQFDVPDAVAFQVVEKSTGDTARGDWHGKMIGVVRPALPWTTEYIPA